jgi:predicted GIY-YIG superfamily endonuclease/lambda repressor-like predicted transcriptional regulator
MADLSNEPTDVYLAYDEGGRLLYAGITVGFRSRLGAHRHASKWWPETARLEVEHYPDRRAALARESEVIRTAQPPYNRIPQTRWREREERIIRLRELGWSNSQIAEEEGMSSYSLERVINRLLTQGRLQPRPKGRRKVADATGQKLPTVHKAAKQPKSRRRRQHG